MVSTRQPAFVILLSATVARAWFGPSIRIDREDGDSYHCVWPAITVGPGASSSQAIYVSFEVDSVEGYTKYRSDIVFQKSTDAGATWWVADALIRRGSHYAEVPDVATDIDGNVYIVYTENSSHVYCVRSSDGGTTWSPPVQVDNHTSGGIGWGRIAADSAGNLFVAWNQGRIYSSISTDKGTTWSHSIRVDDDTLGNCFHADVFVQPGTNFYLVAAQAPYSTASSGAFLYRSTDNGQTFQPGVRLDSFGYTAQPHVVADSYHVICDYTGDTQDNGNDRTGARTLYTQPDTWGARTLITGDDTLYNTYGNGSQLAISADGHVHTALMICDVATWHYLTYYAFSSDHGVSWSSRELVNDDTAGDKYNPDIGADSAGHAYVVWQNLANGRAEVWFCTNNPAAIAEQPARPEFSRALGVEPNPFVRSIAVMRNSPAPDAGGPRVYAQDGRLVRQARIPAGQVRWVWDGRDDSGVPLPPGVYVIEAGPSVRAKVVKLK